MEKIMEKNQAKNYYEALDKVKNIWHADKKSNFYYKEYIRYETILKRIPQQTKTVLDLGCGDGFLSYRIAQKRYQVTAMDLSLNRLKRFKEQAEKFNIQQIEGDITKVDLPSESFDLIVCSEVIEHLPNYMDVLNEVWRLLKKGGHFIVTVPNNQNVKIFTCPHCLKTFYQDDHVNSFTQATLSQDLISFGFKIDYVQVLYSKILNQIQYHLKIPYGLFIKVTDRILSRLFSKYTIHLLIRVKK
jgi:2-polyprenyl-3-methyl-5-hydroxy-6-metoxy-1,4-benzoquinol methylase